MIKTSKIKNFIWLNKPYSIQFFIDAPANTVIFISSQDQTLDQLLSFLVENENIITLDLKWNQQNKIIDLFQIGTSKGAILIQNKGQSPMLQRFLSSHTFYTKGLSSDVQKLTNYLELNNFSFIDVETEYLTPGGYPLDFVEIVKTFGGKPTTVFNSKKILKTNWNNQLNLQQMCYAAFDVIGLCKAIPNIKATRSEVDPNISKLNGLKIEQNKDINELKIKLKTIMEQLEQEKQEKEKEIFESKIRTLSNEKNKLLDQLNKERQEKERPGRFEENNKELVRKMKEEEKIIEEEGRKQINLLPNGLSKEEQLIKSSQNGCIYAVKKLLKEEININAKDRGKRRRDKEIQH